MWSVDKVIRFIETLTLDDKPIRLLDWQRNRLISPLYSAPRPYKKAQLWLPKKQGKSMMCALILLVFLMEQKGKEAIISAATIQQSEIIYNFAVKLIREMPNWEARFWLRDQRKEIIQLKTGSTARIVSGSNKHGKAGKNTSLVLIDEIADFRPADARATLDQFDFSGMANYGRSVMIILSTAGFQIEGHPAFEQFQIAQSVQANPDLDPNQLAIVYAFPEDKLDWKDSNNWWSVLPSCPQIVPKQFYLDKFKELALDTLGENRFKVLLLNIWCNGSGENTWIHKQDWDGCRQEIDERELHGCKAWGGIDLSRRYDLSAYVLLVEKNDKLYILPRFWTVQNGIEKKEQHDHFPYTLHAKNPKNHLTILDGEVIDPSKIRQQIIEDNEHFRMQSIGYDPNAFTDETRQILEYQHGICLTEVKQNYKIMSHPTLQFERWVKTKRFVCDNKVMDWCVENARLKTDGASAIVDSKTSRARIDGVQATVVALQRYLDRSFGMNPLIVL